MYEHTERTKVYIYTINTSIPKIIICNLLIVNTI